MFGKALAAGLALAGLGTAAQAVTIQLNGLDNATGTAAQAKLGFQVAAKYWESVLTNNAVIKLDIGFASFTGAQANVLASTTSTRADVSVANVVTKMAQTASSKPLDTQAIASVQAISTGGVISALVNGPAVGSGNAGTGVNATTGAIRWDTDSTNNRYLYANTSVMKAIGITTNDITHTSFANTSDGSILFNSNIAFDFNPADADAIGANKYDFIGIAIHEIGHALGFTSGVDIYDYYGTAAANGGGAPSTLNFSNVSMMSTLDLFRYSNDFYNKAPGTDPVLDWSVHPGGTVAQGNSYFSIDGGAHQLFGDSRFASGRYNGDGAQASHWRDNSPSCATLGDLDPTFCKTQMGSISALDLAAFDAMGWNLNFDILAQPGYHKTSAQMYAAYFAPPAAVPELATWAQMILGFGVIGAGFRRQRRTVRFA